MPTSSARLFALVAAVVLAPPQPASAAQGVVRVLVLGERADPALPESHLALRPDATADLLAPGGEPHSVGGVRVLVADWALGAAPLLASVGSGPPDPLVVALLGAGWRTDPEAWGAVHAALAARGVPAVVLASHDGLVRDDGQRDGVRYLTIGPADAASLPQPPMDPVAFAHVTLVSIDSRAVGVVTIPAEAIRPISAAPAQDADALTALQNDPWITLTGAFGAGEVGGSSGVAVSLTNPTPADLVCAISVHGPAGWSLSPRQVERVLPAGASIEVPITALAAPMGEERPRLELAVRARLPLSSGEERTVVRLLPVPVWPALPAPGSAVNGAGVFDGRTAAVFPVEAEVVEGVGVRVRGSAPAGSQVVWSTAPAGELTLVWSDRSGGEPMPAAVLRVGDAVAVARSDMPWRWDAWTDLEVTLADGALVLRIDGREAGRAPVPAGVRLSDDLLVVGAAPGGMPGLFNAYFRGRIDSVVAENGHGGVLEVPFDEDVSPAVRDTGTRGAHGWAIGTLRIEAAE